MKKYVIIVAGGKGLRMGSDLPKQFLPVGGKPVLMHTLEVFRKYDLAEQHKAVIPVVDVVETLRHLTEVGSETVSRNDYKLVQTPQVFDVELLKQAYEQEFTPFFTDDASVVEAMGVPVHLAAGNRENIKITTPFDLKVGSALL